MLIFWISSIAIISVQGQTKSSFQKELGINILQIPTTSIDLSYAIDLKPNYTVHISSAYTFNYVNAFDFVGYFLSPHAKCGNNGYSLIKQSGGYLRIGMKYNLRKTMEKNNYFFLGASLSNSIVYEKAEYSDMEIQDSPVVLLKHTLSIFGVSALIGYNFKISERFNADCGLQISIPSDAYQKMYGYTNYIPGLGYMETCNSERIFPQLFLNLKYKLK